MMRRLAVIVLMLAIAMPAMGRPYTLIYEADRGVQTRLAIVMTCDGAEMWIRFPDRWRSDDWVLVYAAPDASGPYRRIHLANPRNNDKDWNVEFEEDRAWIIRMLWTDQTMTFRLNSTWLPKIEGKAAEFLKDQVDCGRLSPDVLEKADVEEDGSE